MSRHTLQIEPLTREAFATFGDVIECSESNELLPINYGRTERHHNLARPEVGADGWPMISIFRSEPVTLPWRIQVMERHPLGSQAFMPLSGHPFLVAVAPPGEFERDKLRVFLAAAHQGVNYHAGTWHHFSLALNVRADFLVIDRGGPGANCDEIEIPQEIELLIPEVTA